MEQFIDIKYINNIINLGFTNKESFSRPLEIENSLTNLLSGKKSQDNGVSHSNENKFNYVDMSVDNQKFSMIEHNTKIVQIENYKNKIIILLDLEEKEQKDSNLFLDSNKALIIAYDIKTELVQSKIYFEKKPNEMFKMFLIDDLIYCVKDTKIISIDTKNLEILREWDIGEQLYTFCIYESSQILKMNMDIFYVNFQNELKFFGQGYLFDIKQKTLYKEQNVIDKILYHDGLLMWSSHFTIKIFDLKNKQMVLRKSYDDIKEEIFSNISFYLPNYIDSDVPTLFPLTTSESANTVENNYSSVNGLTAIVNKSVIADQFKTINFQITNNLLTLNVGNKIIHILKIEKIMPHTNTNFLGINLGFNFPNVTNITNQMSVKLYKILDLFAFKTSSNTKFLGHWINSGMNKLSIIKVISPAENILKNIELNIIKINPEEGSSELILKKNYDKITTLNDFYYSYNEKFSNFLIFDYYEIYILSIIENEEKIIDDLQNNRFGGTSTFNNIYDNFNKFDLSQRSYIVFKVTCNLEKLGIKMENIAENKRLSYMILSIINTNETHKKQIDYYENFYVNGNSYFFNKGQSAEKNTEIGNELENCNNELHINIDNLVHIFNLFMKKKNISFIYKILRNNLKKIFNASNLFKSKTKIKEKVKVLKKYQGNILFDINTEKKFYQLLNNLIYFCIINKCVSKIHSDKDSSTDDIYSDNSNNEAQANNKEKELLLERQKNKNYSNENLKILMDILSFDFNLKSCFISKDLLNFIKKIFYTKIKSLKEKNKVDNLINNSILNDFDDEMESFEEELRLENSSKINEKLEKLTETIEELLDFDIISNLFLKMCDYKKALRCLLYIHDYRDIFDLIKNKKIPFENVEKEFENILENFCTDQILYIIDMLKNNKNIIGSNKNEFNKNNNFDLDRFLKLIIQILKKKFNPNDLLNENAFSIPNGQIIPLNINFDVYELIKSLQDKEFITYFTNTETAEEYLYYILDLLVFREMHSRKSNYLVNRENNDNESNINITRCFIENYPKFEYKKILSNYKENFAKIPSLNILLISLYQILNEYKSIIDIHIEIYKDPEVSIGFIDNLDIFHNKKEELFEYLKSKIIKSTFLSPIKKFYFINLFQDSEEDEQDKSKIINKIYEVKDEEDKKYILLILEQFKLKLKILKLSKNISINNLIHINSALKKLSRKGTSKINLINPQKIKINCDYKFCKRREIKKGDEIQFFFHCNHIFHKKCFESYKHKTSSFENKANSTYVDIDKIEIFENIYNPNIFINSHNDNSADIDNCIICIGYEI